MNNHRMLQLFKLMVCWSLPAAMALGGDAVAAPRTGEAVVAAKAGQPQARIFTGPIHEGRTETVDLFTGSAVGETSRVMTGNHDRICMVLTPGAIVCVAPNTEFTITRLRHSADGLPTREEDIVRQISLDLHSGRILVHAGAPTASLEIKVRVEGGLVDSHGSSFVVAQAGQGLWNIFCEEHEIGLTPENGSRLELTQGKTVVLERDAGGQATVKPGEGLVDEKLRNFELCRVYFQDLEAFRHPLLGFDRQGLGRYLGLTQPTVFLGNPGVVVDVSPSYRPTPTWNTSASKPAPEGQDARRWTEERIWDWWRSVGVVRGVNYVPRNAVNSTEMWMADTFDKDVIDEELGWAHRAGYNAVRVQLQYVVWKADPDGFLDRVERFIALAHEHGLRTVPVLFDDMNLAGRDPATGPQPAPVPGRHNAQWTPSPGASRVKDRAAWPDLEKYLRAVMNSFKRDDRILFWDLYNTVGNDGLLDQSLPLLDQCFNWARDVDPRQPIAVAAWRELGNAMTARQLERSDLVTFQSFDDVENVSARIVLLQRYNRPLFCTDWLLRQQDNTFEKLLPLFSTARVGWFNRGLVKGKTQMWIQQPQFHSDTSPDVWQHDVLQPDGKAYRDAELELIRGFRYVEGR